MVEALRALLLHPDVDVRRQGLALYEAAPALPLRPLADWVRLCLWADGVAGLPPRERPAAPAMCPESMRFRPPEPACGWFIGVGLDEEGVWGVAMLRDPHGVMVSYRLDEGAGVLRSC